MKRIKINEKQEKQEKTIPILKKLTIDESLSSKTQEELLNSIIHSNKYIYTKQEVLYILNKYIELETQYEQFKGPCSYIS